MLRAFITPSEDTLEACRRSARYSGEARGPGNWYCTIPIQISTVTTCRAAGSGDLHPRSIGTYRNLQLRGVHVRVGMEATGYSRWFERLLAELGFEVWIGDPAEIKAKRVKKQKTDRKDAQLLLKLMMEDRFPRIWVPSPENRDVRQLLWHRHRLVQIRTPIINQLQALALNEGRRRKSKLWIGTRHCTT